jgi:triphosphoribosyl-dephospho-CoA synthase
MSDIGDRISTAAQLACLLEASAPKPGNVSPGAAFGDTTYEHFLASAAAIGPALGAAGTRGVGETIHRAVAATRRWTSANTNLGIVLLLAPLARAAAVHLDLHGAPGTTDIRPTQLRHTLGRVLRDTTVHDAREAYAAIRIASPGGLGTSAEQDVAGEPTVTLTDAMRLAQDTDGIAREYATDFHATFESAVPTLASARTAGFDWNDAVVETFLTLLASSADTHIARRAGANAAADVTRQAREVVAAGGVRSEAGRAGIARLHATLGGNENRANPGTTADITAAAIFVVLLGGGWTSPIGPGGHDAAAR